MSNTDNFIVTPEMPAKAVGVMSRKAGKLAEQLDTKVTIPFRYSLGLRVIAEKAKGVTATEFGKKAGIKDALLSNAKQVALAYPDGVPSKFKTWEDVRASLKSTSESTPATSKDKAHAALESDELTNAEFCKVVTAAAGKRSLTAKQRTDLIAILKG